MNRRFLLYAAVVALIAFAASRAWFRDITDRFGGSAVGIHYVRVGSAGDEGASPSLDDSRWPRRLVYTIDRAAGPLWIRSELALDTQPPPLSLYVSVVAPFEVFWDGVSIALAPKDEPGAMDNYIPLDRTMTAPGAHQLAIRIHPGGDPRLPLVHGLAIGEGTTMVRRRILAQLTPVAGLGMFIVIAVYYGSLWITRRQLRDLLFACLCLAATALVILESWRWLFGLTWDWQYARLRATDVVTFAISLLLPAYLVSAFALPRGRMWCASAAAALVLPFTVTDSFDTRCLLMFAVSLGFCVAVIVEASLQMKSSLRAGDSVGHRRTLVAAAAGIAALLVALFAGGYGFSDGAFFLAFSFLIACLLVAIALDQREERRAHESERLRAARLEVELLRRSIQPHFVMNTLTAVMEWMEEDPRQGVHFLHSLADELRILGEIASERLIAVDRELELCRSHLEIMSCRKGTRFRIEVTDVDRRAQIPPAMFHTLLENAITHNEYEAEEVTFALAQERVDGRRRYVLDTPLRGPTPRRQGEGTGLRYVRTRLEESYPGRWRLESAAAGSVWRTVIEVPA